MLCRFNVRNDLQKYYFFLKTTTNYTNFTNYIAMRSVIERKTFVCTRKFVKFVQFVVYNISVVLDLVECLGKVLNDIVDMLCTDAQTHGGRRDVLLSQFLG